jgi:hypothetical protein
MDNADRISVEFVESWIATLRHAAGRIHHCVRQLDDAQLWWRPRPDMNSIANLLLHLAGNMTQWLIAGVEQKPDLRDRPREFNERGPLPRAEVLAKFDGVVAEVEAVLRRLNATRLMEPRHIQKSDVSSVLFAITKSLSHLVGHSQEIIALTRMQLGERYEYAGARADAR